MNTSEWQEVAWKIEKIFNNNSTKKKMGLKKQDYMLKLLSATKALYANIKKPMKCPESYYIGNITMRQHSELIEAIEELEGFIKSGNDNAIKDYGIIVRTFKVMICKESFDQELDCILSDFSSDILQIYNEFENRV